MWITRLSVSQPVFATMMMLALVVLGLFSYRGLRVEQMPEVDEPRVFINVQYPGASPEAIENDVIKRIENVVNGVDGVRNISATAREGLAQMQIEFRLGADMAGSAQEVRDRIAQVRAAFPREMKDPQISRATNDSSQQPVMTLVVHSEARSLREVSTLVEQLIAKRLQNSPGVGNVAVGGAVNRQIRILLRPEQMQGYRVGVDQVVAAVRAANQDLPAGSISRGAREQLVRVEGRIREPRGFERIIVANRGGVPVYLGQVAEIVDGEAEEVSIARVDGVRSVQLNVFKLQEANIVAVGEGVEEALEELRAQLPGDVSIRTLWSNAAWIKGSLERVQETILEGASLTILIVFLFLHSWRSTIITGLTLPISVIATFIALKAFGFTLNFMTLMALSLCIGLLIDDAIVVRENIVRHADMGKSHRRAALEGTGEIGLAVMATTFAILAVFIPVAFMTGVIGRYFLQFGLTVAVAVLVSLFVSFTLDPMLSSIWPDPRAGRFERVPWLGTALAWIEAGVQKLHAVYDRLLRWIFSERRYAVPGGVRLARMLGDDSGRSRLSVSPRLLMIGFAAVTFFASFLLLPFIGSEFQPRTDQGMVYLRLNTPIGSSLEYTDAKVRDAEAAIREIEGVEAVVTTIGTNEGRNYARLVLPLADREITARPSQAEIEDRIRDRLASMAGLQLMISGGNQPVSLSILGPDTAMLTRISRDLMQQLAAVPGIADLESSEKGANPTLAVRIDAAVASDLGLTTMGIGNALRPLVAGDQISRWLGPDGQDYDVIVQLPKARRQVATDIGDLYIASSRIDEQGQPLLVPLRQIAELVETGSPEQIRRLNLQRRISVTANAQGRAGGEVGRDAQEIAMGMQLPPGYRFDVGGGQRQLNETAAAAGAALGLAVIFIYLVLASQFGSFLQPIAIMTSLPLSLIGVFLALLLTGTTLNLFSMIGFIMLMGLVTKNAILLVDFANRGIRAGHGVRQALLDAGQVRLRPILMTTLAMIFGMLPMAIGGGTGGELLAPMGRAVIGGVITSTVLTLVIVPVFYYYLFRIGQRFGSALSAPADAAIETPAATG